MTDGTLLFGWCMDGHHEQCRVTSGKLSCSCTSCGDRHGIAPTEFAPLSESTQAIMDKYRTS
jgi:hypothetical protein